MDWDFIGGFLSGGFATALIKEVFANFWKSRVDRKNEWKKAVIKDIDSLENKVSPIMKLAGRYYGKISGADPDASRELKAEIRDFAAGWNNIYKQLPDNLKKKFLPEILIKFRQSLTAEIDVVRVAVSPFDGADFQKIVDASEKARSTLSELKYALLN